MTRQRPPIYGVFYCMEEVWKDVIDYEGIYEISNLGNIKSLKYNKEKILKPGKDGGGYLILLLSKDKKQKCKKIHQLVAEAFLGHKSNGYKLVINHKDFNRLNNNVENLEIITCRENTNKKHLKSTSKYTGVCWNKKYNKWQTNMQINGKIKHLGYFKIEEQASEAYQNKLKELLFIK